MCFKHFTFPCSQERLCLKTKPSTTPVPRPTHEKAGCQCNNFDDINGVSKKMLVSGFSEVHVKGVLGDGGTVTTSLTGFITTYEMFSDLKGNISLTLDMCPALHESIHTMKHDEKIKEMFLLLVF